MNTKLTGILILVPCLLVATFAFRFVSGEDVSQQNPDRLDGAFLVDTGEDSRLIVLEQMKLRKIGQREFIEGRISNVGSVIADRNDSGSVVFVPVDSLVQILKVDSE